MSRLSVKGALIAALASVALMGATCEVGDSSGGGTGTIEQQRVPQPTKTSTKKKSYCPAPGPITRSQLPALDGAARIMENPCLSVAGMVDNVLGFVPDEMLEGEQEIKRFSRGLKTFVGRVTVVNDAVECAYKTDHLAVAVYQDPKYSWSLGMVAVVRGDVDALVHTAACLLEEQVPFLSDVSLRDVGPPHPRFCADAVSRDSQGYSFKVLWVASSDTMCGELTYAINNPAA
ncbi:hypothetical protein J5X84_14185 [Streptosporangiaceae bacterium NEAU-GS5]|nr:hypothetical protein [Streptosporangiaceae bacterium NEAU-GS5]